MTPEQKSIQFEYSRVAYPGVADGLIHPRNLEVLGSLFGLPEIDLSSCRVLELGCADGTNLFPYAEEFPGSEFHGVDLAEDRIAEANVTRDALDRSNIEFHHSNVTEIDAGWGTFDFILCPGIFSWANAAERTAILRICRENLAPNGIAAVSFNVLPGWNFQGTVRDLIRRHVRVFETPQQQVAEARRVIDFLAANTDQTTAHGVMYAQASKDLHTSTDHYVYHDYISDRNQPFYFHEFQSLLDANGSQFVTDADVSQTAAMALPHEAQRTLDNTPISEREQLLDFLTNAKYRRSLICHSELSVNRQIDHNSLSMLSMTLRESFAGIEIDLESTDPFELEYNGGSLTTVEPLGKAALRHLIEVWPRAVPMAELYSKACDQLSPEFQFADGEAILGRAMLATVCAGLGLAFQTPPVLATALSEHPRASRIVRIAAASGGAIVNQWHLNVTSLKADERFLLTQLDGKHTLADLALRLTAWCLESSTPHPTPAEERVAEILQHLLRDRLLLIG